MHHTTDMNFYMLLLGFISFHTVLIKWTWLYQWCVLFQAPTTTCKEMRSIDLLNSLYSMFILSPWITRTGHYWDSQQSQTSPNTIPQDEFIRLLQRCQALHRRLNFLKGQTSIASALHFNLSENQVQHVSNTKILKSRDHDTGNFKSWHEESIWS